MADARRRPPPVTSSAPAPTAASTWSATFARCAADTIGPMSVARVERVADHERVRVVDELAHEVVVDRLHHVEALGRRAHLAGVQERGPGAALRGDVDRVGDVGTDDEGVLAAQLEVDARDALGALASRSSCRSPTDPVNATQSTRSSRDDRLADVARAGEQVDGARQAGGRSSGASISVDSGVSSLGLQTIAVAGGERGRDLPREQQQRVVPGHDAADDAHRLLHHERELGRLDRRDHAAREVAAHLGVVVERRRGPADLVASSRPAACRPRASSRGRARPLRARRRVATSCSSSPRSPAGHFAPRARRVARGGDRGIDLIERRRRQLAPGSTRRTDSRPRFPRRRPESARRRSTAEFRRRSQGGRYSTRQPVPRSGREIHPAACHVASWAS